MYVNFLGVQMLMHGETHSMLPHGLVESFMGKGY